MAATRSSERLLWPLAGMLVLSGAGSLMLEVVWSRLLKLVFGSTTLAVATILVAYMLGLGIGSRLGGRWAERVQNGVATYGRLEIGIGLYALAVPWLLQAFPAAQGALSSLPFWPAALARFALALVVLILPTVLMGATLPLAVAATVRGSERLSRSIGLLYGANTLGAVAGIVIATYILFPAIGLRATNLVAAAVDVAIGLVALFVLAPRLARASSTERADIPPPAAAEPVGGPGRAGWNVPLLAYGAVGFTALAYEVAWTRTLTMVFGSSVYAFATILAAFLGGIALGSLAGRLWFDRLRRPLAAYAVGIGLVGVTSWIALSAVGALPGRLASLLVERGVEGGVLVWGGLQISLLVLFAPAFVLGALFPLLARVLSLRSGRAARTVGNLAFVNTLGSALGAFAAGFVLIPLLGLQETFQLVIAINLLTAAVVFATAGSLPSAWRGAGAAAAVVATLVVAISPPGWQREALIRGVYYKPELALEFGVETEPLEGQREDELLYYRDGVNVTVSVHRNGSNIDLRLNGKTDASMLDRSTQTLSGHIPAMFGPTPRRALIIGYASGMTAGALSLHDVDHIDVAEIEPAVIEASHFFDPANHRPLDDPRVHLLTEDGRAVLTAAREPYDAIISEPSNPWISGASNLFTAEYFELAARSLTENGSLLQWIQLYGMDEEGLDAVLAALRLHFPHIYGFLPFAQDSDLLLLARKSRLTRDDLPRWDALPAAARTDLARLNLTGSAELWSLVRLTPAEIDVLVEDAPAVNTDDNMFVELRAPWHMYRPSKELRRAFEPFRRGVLGIADNELTPSEIADVALAHLWVRDDPPMAFALLRDSQLRAPSAAGYVAEAELRLSNEPSNTTVPLERLRLALELQPGSADAHYARARLHARAGDTAAALADADAALASRPDLGSVRHLRMRLLMTERRFAEARLEAERLLASPFLDVDRRILSEAALLAGALERWPEAVGEMTRYLEVYPQSPDEWRWLSAALRKLGRTAEAEQAAANADRADRNWIAAAHRHARFAELQGDLGEARATWQFALERQPDYAPAREALDRLDAAETR